MASPRAPSMRLRTQQLMIELADVLDRLLELLIIVQPAADLGNPFATHAELLGPPAGVADRHKKNPVPFTAGAFRAVFGMPDGALQQRATQQFAGDRQLADKLVARLNRAVTNHSLGPVFS